MTGTLISSRGKSAVTWSIQRGQLLINILDLVERFEFADEKGEDFVQQTKEIQLIITKHSKNGQISYSSKLRTIVVNEENNGKTGIDHDSPEGADGLKLNIDNK